MTHSLELLFAQQDQLVTRQQALCVLSERELRKLLGRHWRNVLPGVYASSTAPITARQEIRAGLLHAGRTGIVTDLGALSAYRVPFLPADDQVRLLVADNVHRSSPAFVTIRRTTRLPPPVWAAGFPIVPVQRALCEFIVRHPDERDGLAVAAATVQRRLVTVKEIATEAYLGPARGRPRLMRVLRQLDAGVRSAPEADFRNLVLRSRRVPEPLWNCLIRLPDGTLISPDGLWWRARLIHEVNGRKYHAPGEAGDDVFEDMQRRADAAVTAGFSVLSNTPRRILAEPKMVIDQVAECHARTNGMGLPPGVTIVRYGPPGSGSNVALLHESA